MEVTGKKKRGQPCWHAPDRTDNVQLKLYNSLTRQKEVFVPQSGKRVLWYSCGPTVYDSSHMGHARSYISFDILRRVMQDYFGYDVFYCMNVTDIDDKIILRARQKYLFKQYELRNDTSKQVMADVKEALGPYVVKLEAETDADKKAMMSKLRDRIQQTVTTVEQGGSGQGDKSSSRQLLLDAAEDVLSQWLDKKYGSGVTDNAIFSELPRKFEEEFHQDMAQLNVLQANVLTRVSEYIPEVIAYVQKIIDNGYGYESQGSVYFDTAGFDGKQDHFYAKLVPEAYGDQAALCEGEGELTLASQGEKRSPTDFALWKASKPGEPSWQSPWGKGRPGWHIECSAMASCIVGESMDIHSGGVDLKFPHHDNELAQAEAHFENDHWVRYFLHTGHLTIEGCKMSKSLKNFISIRQALSSHSARQIRLLFLLHAWSQTLDYSAKTMKMATDYEKKITEILLTVKDVLRATPATLTEAQQRWNDQEVSLNNRFMEKKQAIHEALCDSVDTRSSLDEVRELVTAVNSYLAHTRSSGAPPNRTLLQDIVHYVTRLFQVFGADFSSSHGSTGQTNDLETQVMPFLSAIATFRDQMRQIGRDLKAGPVLQLCDDLRDNTLPNLGVRLEDLEGHPSVIKMVDRDILLKEREEKIKQEEAKRLEKEAKKKAQDAAKAEKDAQKKIPPSELFAGQLDKYSRFDDKGIPTHDAEGAELTKSALKKLSKLYDAQEKKYNEFLQTQHNQADS